MSEISSFRWNILLCLRFARAMCFCHSYLRYIRGKEAHPNRLRALFCWRTQLDSSKSFFYSSCQLEGSQFFFSYQYFINRTTAIRDLPVGVTGCAGGGVFGRLAVNL